MTHWAMRPTSIKPHVSTVPRPLCKACARRFSVTYVQRCVPLLWCEHTGEQGAGACGRPEGKALPGPTRLSEDAWAATKMSTWLFVPNPRKCKISREYDHLTD